ncbi:DUF4132 domain-containing protein [Fusobacterium canifelinum]|uniref:DUF4132 domain-containing protein n=1 Tax=Fusobacterium canifelinum TaxID=285729 RepID=A0ABX7CEL6_9FUSO|nr:DUF4132 domain-containing protein [Fusobacterium canifelinum]QQS86922.1 DUF4132 domain-containing protein [Fusobacterium canifelinum]
MLNFYGNKFTTLVNKFVNKVKEEAKKLDRDNQRFIEAIFSKKDYYAYGEIFQNTLKDSFFKVQKLGNIEFRHIFPEKIYPALRLLIGDKFLKDFIDICKKLTKYPYSVSYDRRMVRSINYYNYIDKMFSILGTFVNLYVFNTTTEEIITKKYDFKDIEGWELNNLISSLENQYIIANEIDKGNKKVINYINDALASGSSKNIDYITMEAVFTAENKYLVEMAGKLLLAAQRQEGLRQQICETMDRGTQENFEYMFKIIYDNDLIRFSSIKRALGTWTGLLSSNYENPENIGKKEIEIINKLIDNPKYTDEFLKSDDNVKVYLALWYLASQDINLAIEGIVKLLASSKIHIKLLVSYNLDIFQDKSYQRKIAKTIIKEYAKKDDKDFLKIVACYLQYLGINGYDYYGENKFKKNKDIFDDEKEALEFFEIFEKILKLINNKDKEFYPIIFPWVSRTISKSTLGTGLFAIAYLYPELNLTDKIIPYIKVIESYYRDNYANLLFKKPKNIEEEKFVIKMLGEAATTNSSSKIIKENDLTVKYAEEIENVLRLKTFDVRKNAINLILSLETPQILKSVENLVQAKNENKRLAGLDILTKVKDNQNFAKEKIEKIVATIKEPTDPEKILIDTLLGKSKTVEASEIYDINYEPSFPYEIKNNYRKPNKFLNILLSKVFSNKKENVSVNIISEKLEKNKEGKYIIENNIDIKNIFSKSANELFEIAEKLNALIIKNEDYEYTSGYNGEKILLRNAFYPIVKRNDYSITKEKLEEYPLTDIWKDFYKKEIKNFSTLYQLYLITESYGNIDKFTNLITNIFGTSPTVIAKKTSNDLIYANKKTYDSITIKKIIELLYTEYEEENKDYIFEASKSIIIELLNRKADELLTKIPKNNYYYNKKIEYNTIFSFGNYSILRLALNYLANYYNEKTFMESIILKFALEKKLSEYKHPDNFYSLIEVSNAISLNMAEKDWLLKKFLGGNIESIQNNIRIMYRWTMDEKDFDDYDKNSWNYEKALKVLEKYGMEVVYYIVDNELKRGDSKTKYSDVITAINKIEGVDYLIKILQALGKEKLVRSYWYGTSKKEVLSHLLKICYPSEKDTLKTFKDKIKKTDITEERLVEVAMYAFQWIEFIDKYLNWKGFASGCHYFQAHMNYVPRHKEGIIAKYSPIPIEDFEAGAFDIDWFKDAYKQLGKRHFEVLYECAKYVSDGANHSRARKFADAVLGKMKVKEVEKEITSKRNKDLVAAYSLIPLAKNKIKDAVNRYKFLQKFLKESKQFGAQRRASEAKAVEVSLENLSRNIGYSDVIRLTWAMETEMIAEIEKYFKPKKIQDYAINIEIDELGQSSINYEKDGKVLKSLPTKLKKDKYIEEIKAVHKGLKDQYSRSRKMLEQSMEDGVKFYGYELKTLSTNPVVAPLIKNLVFKLDNLLGYYEDNKLIGFDKKSKKVILIKDIDKDELLTIAHPFDLFNSKQWTLYQQDILERQIKQPFKQVFRELYIKTKDELELDKSRRYAGHQIQPAKTIALLKTRRWVVDDYEGLQKVYYKENIIAKMYAMTDWFSPAEVEAPTIEDIVFYDRKTFEPLRINGVPDLVFSEVMRDIDLVVSVAHVGDVDPEASQSTIEMRRAIVEFNAKLFKLKNVTFTESHALIKGTRAEYSIHLGSGLIHQKTGTVINVLPIHSQHRGQIFLPFIDEDPKTAEIMAKVLLFAQDEKIKDIFILEQII